MAYPYPIFASVLLWGPRKHDMNHNVTLQDLAWEAAVVVWRHQEVESLGTCCTKRVHILELSSQNHNRHFYLLGLTLRMVVYMDPRG